MTNIWISITVLIFTIILITLFFIWYFINTKKYGGGFFLGLTTLKEFNKENKVQKQKRKEGKLTKKENLVEKEKFLQAELKEIQEIIINSSDDKK